MRHQANVITTRTLTGTRLVSGFTCSAFCVSQAPDQSMRKLLTFSLAAGLLVVLQFTPIIRHKLMLVHRINGYIIVLLALVSNVGAIMIAREAFGGTMATQAWIGTLFIITTIGLGLAYYNIKVLQIDQHRAWMLRTWFYVSTYLSFVGRVPLLTTGSSPPSLRSASS